MAGRGRPTFMKRQREAAKERKRREKMERRATRKAERPPREFECSEDVDPDIAGIIPGPQALPYDSELDCSWADFEGWIRSAICGEFTWKVRPRDTRENRKLVIKSIEESLRKTDKRFVLINSFIERVG